MVDASNVLSENLSKHEPDAFKAKFMVLMCMIMMFYISWEMAAVTLGSLVGLQILTFCLNRRIETKNDI